MTLALRVWIARGLIGLAGTIVGLDWALPSNVTLFFDELAMFAIVCAMRWLFQPSKKRS
jgi:hypothetical protein